MLGLLADLLGELALAGLQRRLARDVELARRISSESPTPTTSRGWRVSHTCVSSTGRIPTAPGCQTFSRVTSSPSAWRKRSRPTVMILPSHCFSLPMRSKLIGGLLEQRDRDLQHALERVDADALVGSWLRSVPFARFMHGNPAAMNALASDPPPVTIGLGS